MCWERIERPRNYMAPVGRRMPDMINKKSMKPSMQMTGRKQSRLLHWMADPQSTAGNHPSFLEKNVVRIKATK